MEEGRKEVMIQGSQEMDTTKSYGNLRSGSVCRKIHGAVAREPHLSPASVFLSCKDMNKSTQPTSPRESSLQLVLP